MVAGKWILDIFFGITLTKEDLENFFINENGRKGINFYKRVLKETKFFTKENIKSFIKKWKFITCVWWYKYDLKEYPK